MKTAISISDGTFQKAEDLAERLGMSRSELYSRAVEAYLHSHSAETVTAALDEVYAGEESALEPGTARLQFASFPKEEW